MYARIAVVVLFSFAAAGALTVSAEDAKLGQDDFVSSSISAVFDKVGEYTSGEKRILSEDAEGASDEDMYTEDALGRKVPAEPRLKTGREAALNDPV